MLKGSLASPTNHGITPSHRAGQDPAQADAAAGPPRPQAPSPTSPPVGNLRNRRSLLGLLRCAIDRGAAPLSATSVSCMVIGWVHADDAHAPQIRRPAPPTLSSGRL
jgi:hypothetical protein